MGKYNKAVETHLLNNVVGRPFQKCVALFFLKRGCLIGVLWLVDCIPAYDIIGVDIYPVADQWSKGETVLQKNKLSGESKASTQHTKERKHVPLRLKTSTPLGEKNPKER